MSYQLRLNIPSFDAGSRLGKALARSAPTVIGCASLALAGWIANKVFGGTAPAIQIEIISGSLAATLALAEGWRIAEEQIEEGVFVAIVAAVATGWASSI